MDRFAGDAGVCERTNWAGWTGIALGLLGAMVMLYEPRLGLPVPANAAEWAGLGAGVASAVMNVEHPPRVEMRPEFQAFYLAWARLWWGSVWLLETGPHSAQSMSVRRWR